MRATSQRQGHPRHRPAMLRPELDTLGEALSTWPWHRTGPMFHRVGSGAVLAGMALPGDGRGLPGGGTTDRSGKGS
jgi:hypothetical protein